MQVDEALVCLVSTSHHFSDGLLNEYAFSFFFLSVTCLLCRKFRVVFFYDHVAHFLRKDPLLIREKPKRGNLKQSHSTEELFQIELLVHSCLCLLPDSALLRLPTLLGKVLEEARSTLMGRLDVFGSCEVIDYALEERLSLRVVGFVCILILKGGLLRIFLVALALVCIGRRRR